MCQGSPCHMCSLCGGALHRGTVVNFQVVGHLLRMGAVVITFRAGNMIQAIAEKKEIVNYM